MSEVSDNLNWVADMVEKEGMWCKGEWSAMRSDTYENADPHARMGCSEGLLAERLGLYRVLGEDRPLSFSDWDDDEQEEIEEYYLHQLRQTPEWVTLRQKIIEAGLPCMHPGIAYNHAVINWNDDDDTTEQDVIDMFRKAAIEAS